MKKKLFTIILSFWVVCFLFNINAFAEPWRLLIKATGQGDHVTNVVVGMDPNIDPNDNTWPIAPYMPNFTAILKIIDKNLNEYGEDLRPGAFQREVWNLDLTVGQIGPSVTGDPNAGSIADTSKPNFFPTLSWDTNDIVIGVDQTLELRLGSPYGTLLANMADTNFYETSESDATTTGLFDEANNKARMRYAVVLKGPEEIQQIPLDAGWNLISFQINHCYYEKYPPDNPSAGVDPVFIPQGVIMRDMGSGPGSLEAWLSNDTNSPIRDAADPSKAGNWQRVQGSDSRGFRFMDKSFSIYSNNMTYISAGYGYWILMNEPGTFVLEGPVISSNVSLELQDGWNLIGYIPYDICHAERAQQNVCPYYSGLYSSGEVAYCSVDPFTVVSSVFESINGKYTRIQSSDRCDGFLFYDIQFSQYSNTLRYIGPKYGYWVKIEDPAGAVLTFPEDCTGIQ